MIAVTGLAIQATRDPRGVDPVVPPKVACGQSRLVRRRRPAPRRPRGADRRRAAGPRYEVTAGGGVLTLVRTGALYRDPASDDVWFHPWGGAAAHRGQRIDAMVRRGDVQGDLAAWFEGDELVVYDTVRDSEVLRSTQEPVVNWSAARAPDAATGSSTSPRTRWCGARRSACIVSTWPPGMSSILWEDPYDGDELSQPLQDLAQAPRDVHDDIALWGGAAGVGDRFSGLGPASRSRRWNLRDD